MQVAVQGEDRIDDAVLSLPADGIERTNFGKDIVRDVSTPDNQQASSRWLPPPPGIRVGTVDLAIPKPRSGFSEWWLVERRKRHNHP